MEVEMEVEALEREFGFGVQRIGLSRWNDTYGKPADERAYVALTTLEGNRLLVELTTKGWLILGEGEEDEAMSEERFLELRDRSADKKRHYETMQALLSTESPRYRQAFHERLFSKLASVSSVREDEDEED